MPPIPQGAGRITARFPSLLQFVRSAYLTFEDQQEAMTVRQARRRIAPAESLPRPLKPRKYAHNMVVRPVIRRPEPGGGPKQGLPFGPFYRNIPIPEKDGTARIGANRRIPDSRPRGGPIKAAGNRR